MGGGGGASDGTMARLVGYVDCKEAGTRPRRSWTCIVGGMDKENTIATMAVNPKENLERLQTLVRDMVSTDEEFSNWAFVEMQTMLF